MRYLFTLACLLFVTATLADEADFEFKSKKAKAAVQKYKDEMRKAKKRNGNTLLRSLQSALKHERTDGDLDEALKIQVAIKELKKENKLPTLATITKAPRVVGIWKWHSTIFVIGSDRSVFAGNIDGGIRTGYWEATDKSGRRFKIKWGGGGLDEITMSSSGESFDGFAPSSGDRWEMVRLPRSEIDK